MNMNLKIIKDTSFELITSMKLKKYLKMLKFYNII